MLLSSGLGSKPLTALGAINNRLPGQYEVGNYRPYSCLYSEPHNYPNVGQQYVQTKSPNNTPKKLF